ncbi:MAG TPA: hypothetical protein VN802_14155 [Stellaceae bacterium]|nr:hypothetical protein [Stellaceae bacterium]
MARYAMRLFTDRMAPESAHALAAGTNRVLYCAAGSARVRAGGMIAALAVNSAWHGSGGAEIESGAGGARLLRWELVRVGAPGLLPAADPGIDSKLTLMAEFELDPAVPALMRCDRVNMPAGTVRHLHVQAGPGIRCLQSGNFHLELDGVARDYAPGEAWFERGPDPVFAAGSKSETSHFIRVLVLPASYRGQPSSRTLNPADDAKPQPRTAEIFVDEPIALP